MSTRHFWNTDDLIIVDLNQIKWPNLFQLYNHQLVDKLFASVYHIDICKAKRDFQIQVEFLRDVQQFYFVMMMPCIYTISYIYIFIYIKIVEEHKQTSIFCLYGRPICSSRCVILVCSPINCSPLGGIFYEVVFLLVTLVFVPDKNSSPIVFDNHMHIPRDHSFGFF